MKRISLKAGLLLFFSLLLAVAAVLSPLAAWAQATWGSDQLIENNAGHGGYNPQVAMSGSQTVAVWYQDDGSNNRIYSNCSSDGGVTWSSAQPINNADFSGYNPQVAIDGSQVVAVWEQTDGIGPYRIYSNCSSDGGATWGSDQLIEDNAGHGGYAPQVAMSGSQAVAVWSQSDGSNSRIYSNRSSDGGANWGSDQLIEDNAGYDGYCPQLAISGSQAVAVWYQNDGSNNRIYSNYATLVPPAPVGGTLYPVNKVGVLTPWVVLAVAVIAVGIWLVRRRVYS